jgi:PAS domain S-box-containing protein
LLVLHFIVSYFISRNIWRQMDMFSKFFRKASSESILMESTVLAYKEFREISSLANNMLKERNSILEEIRLSRDEWLGTFDAIGDCIILVDDKGDIVRANKTAAHLHGLCVQSLTAKPFAELCCHDNPVNTTLIDKLPHTSEITNDNLKKIFLASSFPILSPDGRLERIIHIAHDITEQKKLEQQLVQSQKMEALGTLAGGIAHDFNNILTAILGYTDLARRARQAESPVVDYLDQVMQASTRAKELIKQILSFSRQAKTEKLPLQPTPIVQEALKLLRSSMPSTITIKEDINIDSASCILADPTQIHQMVMNICTNAYQAMEENGGILSVSVQETFLDKQVLGNHADVAPGEFIKFSFTDNGPGIPPAIQEKIFDPFFTTKETGKGTGMGLSITHGIVKSYGGFITCNSRLGEGTVFDIYLPTLKKDTTTTANSPEMSQGGSERILFVDDEKMLADMSRIVLEQLGYTVTTYTSSLDALAAFKQNPSAFDLIITDQNMPGMTGTDLAKQLLRIQPNLPIILCTGYSSSVSEKTATSVGIKEFLMKPLVPQEIAAAIRKALGKMEKPLCN